MLLAMDQIQGVPWHWTDDGGEEPRAILGALATNLCGCLGVLNVLADAGDGLGKRGGGTGGFGLGLEAYRPLLEDLGTLRMVLEMVQSMGQDASLDGDFDGWEELNVVLLGTMKRLYGSESLEGLSGRVDEAGMTCWIPLVLGDLREDAEAMTDAINLREHIGEIGTESAVVAQEEGHWLTTRSGVPGYIGLGESLHEDVRGGYNEDEDEDGDED